MQNVQNNFTVEDLVAKYRSYVWTNSPKEFIGFYHDDDGNPVEEYSPAFLDLHIEEQLISALYVAVAGKNAESEVVEALSKYVDAFHKYKDAFSEEEFSYLRDHFGEFVTYMFEHRGNWGLSDLNYGPSEKVVGLIHEYIKPKSGSTIFISEADYCDLAIQFPDCVVAGFTVGEKRVWALGQIRMYVAGVKSQIAFCEVENFENSISKLPNLHQNETYDYMILGAPAYGSVGSGIMTTLVECNVVESFIDSLKPDGKMLFFSDIISMAVGKRDKASAFRKKIVRDKSISSVVSYEYINEFDKPDDGILLVINKLSNGEVRVKDEKENRSAIIKSELIDSDILWPSYYMTARPSEGIPLSSVATFLELEIYTKLVKEKSLVGLEKTCYPEEINRMPFVMRVSMLREYKNANLLTKDWKLVGDFDRLVLSTIKERCVLLGGSEKNFGVGYISEIPETGIATVPRYACLIPKEGIDVRYIAALLLTPEVKNQIVSICGDDVNCSNFPPIMDKIIIPNHSEKERIAFLSEANYEAMLSSQQELKREHESYTKAVRMRKHALTQSLSSLSAMFYALNAYRERKEGHLENDDIISRVKGVTVRDAFEYLSKGFDGMMPVLEHIADVEYSFAKPERIDPEKFVEEYIKKNEKGWLNIKPVTTWKQGHNQAMEDRMDPATEKIILRKGDSINTFLFPKDALECVFKNIVSNAMAHGFVEKTRDDYQLRFSWRLDGLSLIMEIDNNGSPIPNDRDTASLLEYGVSTNLHCDGHNGIGCNEIDNIMRKYDGKVDIISSPEDEFPVKYILTFNRSNI